MRMYADEIRALRISAKAAASVEIDWALSAAHRVSRDQQPTLVDFYRERPELGERVRGLWGPEETLSYPGYLELSSVAHGSGALFTLEVDDFIAGLNDMCLRAPQGLPFSAETPDDGRRLRRRLDLLANDENVRRHYLEVIAEVWDGLRPIWESEGRGAVQAALDEFALSFKSGSDPRQLALKHLEHVHCMDIGSDEMTRLMDEIGDDGEIVLVPAFFTAKGLVVDLPQTLIIGAPAKAVAASSRARTENLARQLKAIADPTRLAILDALSQNDMTITDVTNHFGLAQPTVSNHVKQLRDAGVVTSSNEGRRRQLTVRREVVEEIISALDEIFELGDSRHPSPPAP